MPYTYRITAEKLDLPEESEPVSCTFEITNHDDIVPLIERVKSLNVLPEDEVAQFTIGLKLFSAIHMAHRREALFAPLHPHFLDFMKRLKSNAPGKGAEPAA
jgi:hypothetical protein